jgi:hypothetical protein
MIAHILWTGLSRIPMATANRVGSWVVTKYSPLADQCLISATKSGCWKIGIELRRSGNGRVAGAIYESWIRCELARMPVAVHARRTCVVGVALGI